MADTTITALFDSRDDAQAAVDRLIALGLEVQNIHMTGAEVDEEDVDQRPIFDRIGDFLFPDEDRDLLARGVEEGAVMVTVLGVPDAVEAVVVAALDDAGAVEIDEDDAGPHGDALADVEAGSAPVGTGRDGDDARAEDIEDALARVAEAGTLDEMGAGTSGMRGMRTPHAGAMAGGGSGRARLVRRYPRRGDDGVAPERGNMPS
ncbi:MAG: hypothetical protein Q27BPR15_18165 [Rhodobacter sp. CACIA14H1]|nr:MAG: hypothetical protein Q27BPR15_18165 [Rhodobacter sp. CACIA14H1]